MTFFNITLQAAEKGYKEIASYLIGKGANVTIVNKTGMNALKYATMNRHDAIVSMIRQRMEVLANDRLALLDAVKAGDEEAACTLIENGSNVHIKYDDGCNPLIKSSNFGYERIVKCLIAHGADVNVTSGSGNTALMKAAEAGNTVIAKMLIDAGTLLGEKMHVH
jgi:ankyrin repeat protein